MDNGLENLFTNLSISSDTITKEDFKKKDCKKGKGGWQKEDLLKICKDLGIKLTSKDKASKELLCEKINNYFNTNVVNVANNVANDGDERPRTNRPSPSDSATQFPVGTTKIGNDGNMYKVILTSNGRKRWVKSTDTVTSDTVTTDTVTTDTTNTNVSTTNSNLENLPNGVILQILEKMPLSSMFNTIKASKKINMLFNKFKNSIIKNHIKYYGKGILEHLFLYNIKNNKKEFKEAIEFVYKLILEGEVSQVNIKKWIKKIIYKNGELSADEAIIILEFIKKNNFKSSEFLLDEVTNKLDFGRIKNLEAFDVILDINYELNEKLLNSYDEDEHDEEYFSRWPGNEIFDKQEFERWVEDLVKNLVLTDSNPEKFNIIKKNKNIRRIARWWGDDSYEDELLGGWGESHRFETDRESDNFKKYFPKLYKEYSKTNRYL